MKKVTTRRITGASEDAHQKALFEWAALKEPACPEIKWLHAIPNGGSRGDSISSRMIRGARLKAQGVKSGVADVFLPVKRGCYSGLYIEMKRPDIRPARPTSKGGVSAEQADFGEFVQSQGFLWAVCYGWEEAANLITAFLEEK